MFRIIILLTFYFSTIFCLILGTLHSVGVKVFIGTNFGFAIYDDTVWRCVYVYIYIHLHAKYSFNAKLNITPNPWCLKAISDAKLQDYYLIKHVDVVKITDNLILITSLQHWLWSQIEISFHFNLAKYLLSIRQIDF